MDNLQERVIALLKMEGIIPEGGREIDPSDNFVEDYGADSLDMVELVMMIEEEFDIEISDELASGWTTVETVVSTVRLLLADEEA